MKALLFNLFLLITFSGLAQSRLQGLVKDEQGRAVFAANVYLKAHPEKGITTDFDGKFSLATADKEDSLVVSFIGFKTRVIPLSTLKPNKSLLVVLQRKSSELVAITATAKDPVSEQFSVRKLNKLDIYLNPVSQGDPLKAITTLAISTNTEETANPSIRGSVSDRSRVLLNGVPIYKPVRTTQLNNKGFFSLFNPEIVQNLYVYASNPPLTYGNASAGLVEIQTTKSLLANQLQLSTTLGSLGAFLSQKTGRDGFIQAYGNFQVPTWGFKEKIYLRSRIFKPEMWV